MPKLATSDADFKKWADLIPESLVLIDVNGCILGVNRQTVTSGLFPASVVGEPLDTFLDNSAENLTAYLKQCCRSRGGVVGSLHLKEENARVRCEGSLLEPASDDRSASVLLRILNRDNNVEQFTFLNEKVISLAKEVERRRIAESHLRDQHALAAFGHSIGMILAQDEPVPVMLQNCCQSIVDHLGAAFARVWLADEDGETLTLTSSAGMYTHLNGEHASIKFGQYKIGMIAAEQQAHLTNCVVGDKHIHNQAWAKEEKMIAFAGYPLVIDGKTIGVVAMFAQHELSDQSLESLATVSNGLALGISRKHVEIKLRLYADELVNADRRKDEFLAMLAHELRNPLAPLRTGLELLNLDPGEHIDTLRLMREQVQHLARLVDDLLDISRIMRNKIELRRQTVQLNESVRSAYKSLQQANKDSMHDIHFRDIESPIWVNVDPVRLSQILMNLLNNATKYTPEGGSIWLEYEQINDQATVTVRDNGIGIEESFRSRVFELFAQADQSLDRSQGGLGIGLTLTQRLLELHGGTIHVESEGLNKGSMFTICLPVTDPPQHDNTEQTNQYLIEQSYRILVVDDIVGSAKMLKRLLNAVGQTDVETAHDGHAAIEAARQMHPQIIFLDIGLPGLNGYEVAAELRSDPDFKETVIVALTGYGDAESRTRTAQAGFNQHLVKPVGLDDLKVLLSMKLD